MDLIKRLEAMLADGQDSALLRFSLGNAYLKSGDYPRAIAHLAQAIRLDRDYSAAWKFYADALNRNGQTEEAISAYESGIVIAEKKGDLQAAREMKVFLKRLRKGFSP